MKRTVLAALLLCSGLAHAAGFTGLFAPGNWTQSAGTGSVNSFDASSLSMSSGDDGSDSASNTDVTIVLASAGTISFDWAYSTNDEDAFWDPFSVLTPTALQLTDDDASSQSGSYSFSANLGDVVGFQIRTIDNLGGSATIRISNFSFDDGGGTPAPEPGALALVGVALASAAWIGRRQRRSSVATSAD